MVRFRLSFSLELARRHILEQIVPFGKKCS